MLKLLLPRRGLHPMVRTEAWNNKLVTKAQRTASAKARARERAKMNNKRVSKG